MSVIDEMLEIIEGGFKDNPELGIECDKVLKQVSSAAKALDVAAELILEGRDAYAHELLGDDLVAISMASIKAGEVGKYRKAGGDGGKASKRRWWADCIAQHLKDQQPSATKENLWRLIPDSANAETITTPEGEIEFYQDTDNSKPILMASIHSASADQQKTLTKKVFFDTYLKKKPE